MVTIRTALQGQINPRWQHLQWSYMTEDMPLWLIELQPTPNNEGIDKLGRTGCRQIKHFLFKEFGLNTNAKTEEPTHQYVNNRTTKSINPSYLLRRVLQCGWWSCPGSQWWPRTGRRPRQVCCVWSAWRSWWAASHRAGPACDRPGWATRHLSSSAPWQGDRCRRSSWVTPGIPSLPRYPRVPQRTRKDWRASWQSLEIDRK